MTHPINDLQTALVAALAADAALIAAIGDDAVFDAVPKKKKAPFVVVARHDVLARNADLAPGYDHRVRLDAWYPEPDRTGLTTIVERVVAVLGESDLSNGDTRVTHRRHMRTETVIEPKSGHARASIYFQFFSEPDEQDQS